MKKPKKLSFEIKDIPAMPNVATQVMHMVTDPNISVREIARVISADPAIITKVLQIANSPFFGCTKKITTITEAVVLMGMNALKSLVIAIATKNLYKNAGLSENLLWEHSIGVSIASSIIARETRSCPVEDAFIGGLLHDVGKIISNMLDHDKYVEVIKSIYEEDAYFYEKEEEILGYSHCDAGYAAIHKWQLSEKLEMVQFYHHSFRKEDERPDLELPYITTIIMGNQICNHLGIGRKEPSKLYPLKDTFTVDYFEFNEKRLNDLCDRIFQSFEKEKSIFN